MMNPLPGTRTPLPRTGFTMVRMSGGSGTWAVEAQLPDGGTVMIRGRGGLLTLVDTPEEALEVVAAWEERRAQADKLSAAIEASGLSARKYATDVLLRNERTVRRWLACDTPIPREVLAWLDGGAERAGLPVPPPVAGEEE